MAIVGAILGDIAGSRWERKRENTLDWKHIELFTDKCFYTDDTVLTLATKYKFQNHISFVDSYHKFGNDYPKCGYGGRFYRWLSSYDKKAYNSYGNGAAMRCSYIGEYFNTESEVIEWATKSAECTHNHPEGIKGAVVTSMCIYMAKKGASKAEILDYARKQYPMTSYEYSVEYELNKYRDTYKWDASCQGSVPVAIRCFLDSEDYESFIRNVLSLNCDTDTLCAIGGGIAEEFYQGTGFNEEWILKNYLDDDLYKIARS